MVVCFLCGSNDYTSNDEFKQLRSLQSKSTDSMKCVLNNMIGDSGITASDKDVVCLHCEVLCQELDIMEYERLIMRKILRRLLHSTFKVNNLDRSWCQLDHKALGQFKVNGTSYECKKCDFKTKRFAHITPHHTLHEIKSRKSSKSTKSGIRPSAMGSPTRRHVSPKQQRTLENKDLVDKNEIFEFNIDSHEGECLYSLEDVSIKCVGKEKSDEFECDLYYPEDCEEEEKPINLIGPKTNRREVYAKATKINKSCLNSKQIKEKNIFQPPFNQNASRCRRLEYLYALQCGCAQCVKLSSNLMIKESPKKENKVTTLFICETCDEHFVDASKYKVHDQWCRIKSALKQHVNSVENILKTKNKPQCSTFWLNEQDQGDLIDNDDDFYDLGAVDIEDVDMQGDVFDEKLESFLRKTAMRLNTIDIEFVPI